MSSAPSPTASPQLRKLNIGCGARALPHWSNLDFVARPGLVQSHDLRQPLPFADSVFDVVYHSHLLEHLDPSSAQKLIGECQRVLRPGGLLRVVVPDLEQKARLYLEKLDRVRIQSDPPARRDHRWMLVELLDQMVRTRSGGEMQTLMSKAEPGSFIEQRIGRHIIDESRPTPATPTARSRPHVAHRFAIRCRMALTHRLTKLANRFLGITMDELDWLRFRQTGECHLWMYDEVSLATLLTQSGFAACSTHTAFDSEIPRWESGDHWLDVEANQVRKPDSLFMEARRV